MTDTTCPVCGSPLPNKHPVVKGRVEICVHDFHLQETRENGPVQINTVLVERQMRAGTVVSRRAG